jgi:DNA-binding MarR family transcriptional regulator
MKVEIEAKIKMAYSEMNKDNKDASVKLKAQQARILGILSKSPTKLGLIVNRCRGMEKSEVLAVLDSLVKAKLIKEETEEHAVTHRPYQVYLLVS